jgi:hypothetical protein
MRLKEKRSGMSVSPPTTPMPPPKGGRRKQRIWGGRIIFIPIFFLFFGPLGCISKTLLNPDIPLDQRARIQGSSSSIFYGVVIDAIDGNVLDLANSAYISPGSHGVRISYYIGGAPNCTDYIRFSAQPGREYIVKVEVKDMWAQSPTRCFFWIEDVKTREVVAETPPHR